MDGGTVKPCTTIVGQSPEMEHLECGEEGVEIHGIVRCRKHWASVRGRANRIREKSLQSFSPNP